MEGVINSLTEQIKGVGKAKNALYYLINNTHDPTKLSCHFTAGTSTVNFSPSNPPQLDINDPLDPWHHSWSMPLWPKSNSLLHVLSFQVH